MLIVQHNRLLNRVLASSPLPHGQALFYNMIRFIDFADNHPPGMRRSYDSKFESIWNKTSNSNQIPNSPSIKIYFFDLFRRMLSLSRFRRARSIRFSRVNDRVLNRYRSAVSSLDQLAHKSIGNINSIERDSLTIGRGWRGQSISGEFV